MPTVVDIIFTGVVAFISNNPNPTTLTAVFPNGSMPQQGEPEAHFVYLLVEQGRGWTLSSDTGGRIETRIDPRSGKDFWYAEIRSESVALANVIDRGLVLERSRVFYRRKPVRAGDNGSLHWLARLDAVWPGDHQLKAGVLGSPADVSAIRARMNVGAGTLSAAFPGEAVWRIIPRSIIRLAWERSMAQEIRLRLNVQDSLALVATPFGGGAPVTFTLSKSQAAEEPVILVVGNTPCRDVLPTGSPCAPAVAPCELTTPEAHTCIIRQDPRPCTCVDHHFELYYKLFEDQPSGDLPIPYRIESFQVPVHTTTQKLSGANCPPVRLGW